MSDNKDQLSIPQMTPINMTSADKLSQVKNRRSEPSEQDFFERERRSSFSSIFHNDIIKERNLYTDEKVHEPSSKLRIGTKS